jgi:serine/threonine-protein kinase SRPK3
MLQVGHPSVLTDYQEAETHNPSLQKVIDEERTIYTTRVFRRPKDYAYGTPVLCDFGEARIGTPQPYAEIQPEIYKAPEILMQFGWDHAADIWNAACLVSRAFLFPIKVPGLLNRF